MEFKVTIKELLCRELSVRAETREEAVRIAREMYERGEVVLDWDDHRETEIG